MAVVALEEEKGWDDNSAFYWVYLHRYTFVVVVRKVGVRVRVNIPVEMHERLPR